MPVNRAHSLRWQALDSPIFRHALLEVLCARPPHFSGADAVKAGAMQLDVALRMGNAADVLATVTKMVQRTAQVAAAAAAGAGFSDSSASARSRVSRAAADAIRSGFPSSTASSSSLASSLSASAASSSSLHNSSPTAATALLLSRTPRALCDDARALTHWLAQARTRILHAAAQRHAVAIERRVADAERRFYAADFPASAPSSSSLSASLLNAHCQTLLSALRDLDPITLESIQLIDQAMGAFADTDALAFDNRRSSQHSKDGSHTLAAAKSTSSESGSRSPTKSKKAYSDVQRPGRVEEDNDADVSNVDAGSVLLVGHGEDDELLCVFFIHADEQKLVSNPYYHTT
jgi:hypothetical protein